MKLPVALALTLLLLPLAPAPVRADEKEGSEDLVTRLFDVSALTQGRYDYRRELSPSVDLGSEDEVALFGVEGPEPIFPIGQVDELIEFIQMQVRPESWGSTLGAEIRTIGEGTLVVRSFPDVVDEVAAYLAGAQRRIMRRVVVDVQTFRLSRAELASLLLPGDAQLADPAKLERYRAMPQAGPGTSIVVYERSCGAIYAGLQHSYVADYDVEVAKQSKISDPIVHVANLGLSVDVRATLAPDAKSAVVVVDAALSEVAGTRTVDAGDGRMIELPDHRAAGILTRVETPVGAWTLIDGQTSDEEQRWTFAVRVSALPDDGLADAAAALTLSAPPGRPARRFEQRTYDVGALLESSSSRSGEVVFLTPSNFTPPEPPELPEPMPLFPTDALAELLREYIVPASWEMKGAYIEARNGYLFVRNSREVLDAITATLDRLGPAFLWSLVTTGEVVDVPAGFAHRLELAPGRVLTNEARTALDAALASGEAQRLGSVRVMNMRDGRNAAVAGRRMHYLQDYEVELAEGSALADPVIQQCLSGSGLDVEPRLTAGGQSVQMNLQFTRAHVRLPLRKASTPHGDIDVPELEVFRVRSSVRAPLGATLLAGSASAEGRTRLLLVSSHLRRSARK